MEDEISRMHPIRPYENDSLCEIDSDPEEGGGGQLKNNKISKIEENWYFQ